MQITVIRGSESAVNEGKMSSLPVIVGNEDKSLRLLDELRPFSKRKDTISYSFGNVYLLAEQRLKWNVVRQNGNNFLSLIE